MRFNVVARIIAGFALMAVLLLFASIASYIGLSSIRTSAESVIQVKMPAQQQMIKIQTDILEMGKHSLAGFHARDLARVELSHNEFLTLKQDFNSNINLLKTQLADSPNQSIAVQAQDATAGYMQSSEKMYELRIDMLKRSQAIAQQLQMVIESADDIGAFLLDLSFLEGAETDQRIIELVGTGTGIDNGLQSLKSATRDYVAITDKTLNLTVIGDIKYAISVLDSQVEYLNQSAQGIDTDGIVPTFSERYENFKLLFFGSDGILEQQSVKVDVLSRSQQAMDESEIALESSIGLYEKLFDAVNGSTLEGQNEIINQVHANIIIGFAVLAFGLCSVVVIGFIIARNISVPLEKIKHSLSVISDGDLTHQADDSGNDEFALLASKVNELCASLHLVVERILTQENALNEATKISVKLGEENINQAALQFQQIGLTNKNTQDVRQTSANNLKQIEQGSLNLKAVSEQINQVGSLIQRGQAQILTQAKQAKASTKTINSLEQNSKSIGSILDVIKNIAEQTNLLALNAAIEAARAGEHGRGFAVVADEVRTLAIRTQSSTAEIEQMIITLQQDAQSAVKEIEMGQSETEQSVALIDSVNAKIVEILSIVSELSKVNAAIVENSRGQDSLLEKVGRDLDEVVHLAQLTGERTEKRNKVTHEMSDLMAKLSQTVSKFKL